MYFGLQNLPGIFQRMMNSIFQILLHKGVLANYMDNFIIPAKTKKELEEGFKGSRKAQSLFQIIKV